MGPNKFVHLMFALGALLLAFIVSKMTDWAWSYFRQAERFVSERDCAGDGRDGRRSWRTETNRCSHLSSRSRENWRKSPGQPEKKHLPRLSSSL